MQPYQRERRDLRLRTSTVLKCILCTHQSSLLRERVFKCPECGNLYDVVHEYGKMSATTIRDAKERFRRRANMAGSVDARSRSGVWRYHELVMPGLKPDQLVTLGEGIVPIVPAGNNLHRFIGGDVDIWMILEGQGPTGSFKDFGGAAMMSVAKAADIRSVGCASTGDTSAMLAAYSAAAGLQCFVLLPRGQVTPVQIMQPAAHGARVIQLDTDFDGCMRTLTDLVGKFGVYPGNSLNPSRIEGHKATVFLIAQFFQWKLPEWIAVPVGNGSNSSSVGKAQRELLELGFVQKGSRILGAQSVTANPLASSWQMSMHRFGDTRSWEQYYKPMKARRTIATATKIGSPVSRLKVIREIESSDGAMESVSEKGIAAGMLAASRDGFLVCPQTGIAIEGVRQAVASGTIARGERVVIVSTATGMKFAPVYNRRIASSIERATGADADTVAKMLGI